MSYGPSTAGSIAGTAGDLASLGGMALAPFTGGASAAIPMAMKLGGTAASMGGGLMNSITGQQDKMAQMQAQQNQAQANADAGLSMSASNPSVSPYHQSAISPLMQIGGTTSTMGGTGMM